MRAGASGRVILEGGLHGGNEFGGTETFAENGDAKLLGCIPVGGDGENLRERVDAENLADRGIAAHHRHLDVHQHQVGVELVPHLDRLAAVLRLEDLVGVTQHHPVDDQQILLVFSHQQFFLHSINIHYRINFRQLRRSLPRVGRRLLMTAGCRSMAAMQQPGVGLALSGGAARGIAHAGVLEVLVEAGIAVRALAGTSAGSVVGALFAAGVPPVEIGRMALETRWGDLFRVRLPHAGMISGEGLERFFERVIPARTFAELRLPFVAVATDLATGRRVDCTSGPLARAVLASCSLPVLLEPVSDRGRLLVDGGVSSQLPVRAVRETLGVSPVVAVDVNVGGLERPRLESLVDVAVHLAQLWSARTAREEEAEADLVIGVDARGIALHDLSLGREALRRGREAARKALPAVRALAELLKTWAPCSGRSTLTCRGLGVA